MCSRQTLLVLGMLLAACPADDLVAATVSGRVTVPPSTFGWQPDRDGMTVRVQGTALSAPVDFQTGEFTLADAPAGPLTLILLEKPGQDVFTAASKRVSVQADASGVEFALEYHWRVISYPPVWGQNGYNRWRAFFVSDQVVFTLFRVAGEGIDPERMELYRTVDGGQLWSLMTTWTFNQDAWTQGSPYPDNMDYVFHFSDAEHGVVLAYGYGLPCSGGVGMFHTSDGGHTWGFASLPGVASAYPRNIHRIAQISPTHLIAAGGLGCNVQGYRNGFYDVIWESTDAGGSWQLAKQWEIDYGACTGLGAAPSGNAVAFFTPYGGGERRVAVRNASTGGWQVTESADLVVNSGYGPADVAFTGSTAFIRSQGGTLPDGLYRSDAGGAVGTWTRVSDTLIQYMSFADTLKGFGPGGGPMYVTYDGGATWLHQAPGGGFCCHGNDVWAFDATHAAWRDGGVGDPDGAGSLLTYSEPLEANFEVTPGHALADASAQAGTEDVPGGSWKLMNHGPVPVAVGAIRLNAAQGSVPEAATTVTLWRDADANGSVGASDTVLSEGAFSGGSVELSTGGITLRQYVPVHLLLTYDLATAVPQRGTIAAYMTAGDVTATREDTGQSIAATGPTGYPLSGPTITVEGQVVSEPDPVAPPVDPSPSAPPVEVPSGNGDDEENSPVTGAPTAACGAGAVSAVLLSALGLCFIRRGRR